MKLSYVYKPVRFFVIIYLITWISWFLAAFVSYQKNGESIYVLFMVPGLIAPFATALWMILSSKNEEIKHSFVQKLIQFRSIKLSSIPIIFLMMPVTVVFSILISLLFGQSNTQLQLSEGFSFSVGFAPVLLVLILAASFEELGWRSYAMDSLNSQYNYFTATMIFAVLWAFWHFPLFFINHYYQNELLQANIWFAINFMASVFPMAFIIGWLCRKNGGNILVAILFHFAINLSQEALQMTQITKCIETVVLIGLAAIIVMANKKMFFEKANERIL